MMMPGYSAVLSAVRICRAADTLPLNHTALLWQRTAGSDSVLLSLEITQTTPKISIPFASIS